MSIYSSGDLSEIMKNHMCVMAVILMIAALGSAHAGETAEVEPTTLDTITVSGAGAVYPAYVPIYTPITFSFDYAAPSGGDTPSNPNLSDGIRVNNNDCSGNPVDRFSGNKVEPETDFIGSGEMPLTMQRIYSSGAADSTHPNSPKGILGEKWRTSFDYSVEIAYGGGILFARRPNGQRIGFTPAGGTSRYESRKEGMYVEITQTAAGFPTFLVLHTKDGETETYQTTQHDRYYNAGKIVERKNAQGVSWKFSYVGSPPYGRLAKVEHSSGRSVTIGYDSIIDQAGNAYGYAYSNGNLISVTKPGTPSTTISYHYENSQFPKALTGKSFNGVRYSTFSYDAGRATSTQHAGEVERYSFIYSGSPTGTWQVTETNPLGNRLIHAYQNGKKISVTGEASPHCAYRYRTLTYDVNGYDDVVTDFMGARTDFDYDEHGHLLRKIEAVGQQGQRTTSYVWDEARSRIVTVTLEGVNRIAHTYDGLDRVASRTVTDLDSGQVRATTYSYTTHPNKLLATYAVDGPLAGAGDALTYSYSANGNLISAANALGQATTYSNHNGLGQPGKLTGANGAVTEYEYDASGRVLLQRTFPNGSPVETRYVYGASGLLDAKTHSDGSSVYYHYDAAQRLLQEDLTEPGGGFAVKRYTYNAMSKPIKIEIGRDN
jgi:YD repeat-containing protein